MLACCRVRHAGTQHVPRRPVAGPPNRWYGSMTARWSMTRRYARSPAHLPTAREQPVAGSASGVTNPPSRTPLPVEIFTPTTGPCKARHRDWRPNATVTPQRLGHYNLSLSGGSWPTAATREFSVTTTNCSTSSWHLSGAPPRGAVRGKPHYRTSRHDPDSPTLGMESPRDAPAAHRAAISTRPPRRNVVILRRVGDHLQKCMAIQGARPLSRGQTATLRSRCRSSPPRMSSCGVQRSPVLLSIPIGAKEGGYRGSPGSSQSLQL